MLHHLSLNNSSNFTDMNNGVAPPENVAYGSWYMDSGATHHFTPNLKMMDIVAPFTGSDQVIAMNGKMLPISHVGHASLPSLSNPILLKTHIPHTFNFKQSH